jgi:AraC-like DNA-binding protein
MSPRTFARWFAARTGTTPHQWLTSQRLMTAQEMLERTDHGIEQIAADCGLAPLMLRRHFTRRRASRRRPTGTGSASWRAEHRGRRGFVPVPLRIIPNEWGLLTAGHHEAASAVTG